uniref:Leucine-rich repeat-containing N-terminal plant-type domain-containing protein n=1 Tax=Lactuca sativa TaxID=4236 RepID=A0A9R1VG99_LACSA|nr:hypothetical protein LSAT_V11C500281720 [Lactuca sativa]
MNPCLFLLFSLLLLLVTKTASQLGGDYRNGVTNKCLHKERLDLLLFKASLHDPNDTLSTWRSDEHDCCNWKGVTCNNQTCHVIGLDISGSSLGGEINNSLLNLTYLNHLDLSRNSFHGIIPSFIGSMTRLRYLNLSYNSFHRTIPLEFGNLTNLQWLYLGSVGSYRVDNLEWLSHLSHLEELQMDEISLAKQNHWVDVTLSLRKLSLLSLKGCELS